MSFPNWILFIVNMLFCASFTFASISTFINNGEAWWIWGLIAIFYGFSVTKRFGRVKKEGWAEKEPILDQRTWNHSKTSGYISFIYLMLFLLFGIIANYNGFLSIEPMSYMILALFTGMLVFALLQIFHSFLR